MREQDMDQVMIKGFIIGNVLDLVRGTMSASDFADLEAELGLSYKTLKLAYFKDYPVEIQLRAEEKVAQILWHRSDDGAFYKFGRLNFEAFAKTAIGRTALALVGKDPKRLVKASIRLMSTVMKGMKIEVEDRGEDSISFRFRNNPYRPLGWQGVIDAVLESAGVTPEVKIVKHGPTDTEYLVTWS